MPQPVQQGSGNGCLPGEGGTDLEHEVSGTLSRGDDSRMGGKASVYRKVPFTIKLSYKTGSTTQPGYLGIDTGSQHIGGSVVREDGTVLHKEEISLRDSMTKRKLLEARASLRRGRRYRKTRYRHPKWKPKTRRVYCEVPDKKGRHWQKQKNTFT